MSIDSWEVRQQDSVNRLRSEQVKERLAGLRDDIRDCLAPLLAASPWRAAGVDIDGWILQVPQHNRAEVQHIRNIRREAEYIAELRREVQPTEIFWDIGANIGIYSAALANACRQCVAFEPSFANREEISRTLALNGVNGEVEVHPNAVCDSSGTEDFQVDSRGMSPGAGRGGLTNYQTTDESAEHIEVRTVRGDELVESGAAAAPDVIKIDVEGAEVAVLDGLVETLQNDRPRLIQIETHGTRQHIGVISRLREFDYNISTTDTGSNRLIKASDNHE